METMTLSEGINRGSVPPTFNSESDYGREIRASVGSHSVPSMVGSELSTTPRQAHSAVGADKRQRIETHPRCHGSENTCYPFIQHFNHPRNRLPKWMGDCRFLRRHVATFCIRTFPRRLSHPLTNRHACTPGSAQTGKSRRFSYSDSRLHHPGDLQTC